MTAHRMEAALVAITIAGCAVALRFALAKPRQQSQRLNEVLPPAPVIQLWDFDSLSSVATRIVATNPFRLERRPATVRYAANQPRDIIAPTTTPPVSRPQLVLVGIVGGPPWRGILEGVPGRQSNVLVSAGDTLANLRVLRVSAESLYVAGSDTAWAIGLRRHQ